MPSATPCHAMQNSQSKKGTRERIMTLARSLARTSLVAASAMTLTALCFVTIGNTWAAEKDPHDKGGPVIFLNRHGTPTECSIAVDGVKKGGDRYQEQISRKSCDGTLWTPELELDSSLTIALYAKYPQKHSATAEVFIKKTRDDARSYVNNDTALCFLVKSDGDLIYTNMSAKGGDCNGK